MEKHKTCTLSAVQHVSPFLVGRFIYAKFPNSLCSVGKQLAGLN